MPDSPIRLLVLDINGVLYRYDPARRIDALAGTLGVDRAEVDQAFFGSGLEDAADAGEIDPDEYLRRAGESLGRPLDRQTWADALAAAIEPDETVLDLIAPVVRRVQATTLSNNGLLVREMVDHLYPRLGELPIECHVAAEFGESKPDTDVYLDVCERFGVAPREAAFVDDKERNVRGAERAGLVAHRFVGVDALRSFLDELELSA
ncbi:MAG: HAD-IA family hydrolase [Acidimicrobiales bacterium]|nr:HAD-IA family hydrolase [Acidimicrobiales bacterium]